jgi:hypothetical protein
MKKALYLAMCLVLVASVGCAITDYEIITDNDQVANGQGSGVINTNGKALIESTQVGIIQPDGIDQLFTMVDQRADGVQTLTTYNNFTSYGSGPTFMDTLYCNPDWQGCAILTATDTNDAADDPYDYDKFNPNCSGARSIVYIVSTTRYYGECGRAKLSLADRLALLNMARISSKNGSEMLVYDINRNNTTITLDNKAGVVSNLPITGDYSVAFNMQGKRQALVNMANPLAANMGRALADFSRNYGSSRTDISLNYNGISYTIHGSNPWGADRIMSYVNAKY